MRKTHARKAGLLTLFGQRFAPLALERTRICGRLEGPRQAIRATRSERGCHMLKILVLICPMSVDHAACDTHTATDVIRSMRVSSPQQCGFMGQATLAPTSLVPEPGKQYVKIMCVRDQPETVALAKP